jgi:hypothetical protein
MIIRRNPVAKIVEYAPYVAVLLLGTYAYNRFC